MRYHSGCTYFYIAFEEWHWDGRGIKKIIERDYTISAVHPFEWLHRMELKNEDEAEEVHKHYIILWERELTPAEAALWFTLGLKTTT